MVLKKAAVVVVKSCLIHSQQPRHCQLTVKTFQRVLTLHRCSLRINLTEQPFLRMCISNVT